MKGKQQKTTKIPLKTVRPFYIEDVVLRDTDLNPDDPKVGEHVEAYCKEKVWLQRPRVDIRHKFQGLVRPFKFYFIADLFPQVYFILN